jgi:hypothetical protein
MLDEKEFYYKMRRQKRVDSLLFTLAIVIVIFAGQQMALAENLGTATIIPSEVRAGSKQSFKVTYTAETPISTGGGIKIYFATPFFHKCPIQAENPNTCGYVQVSGFNPTVKLGVKTNAFGGPEWGTRLAETTITVAQGTLREGDKIILVYGAGEQKAYAQEIAHNAEVTVLVSTAQGQPYQEIQSSPVLRVNPTTCFKVVSAINQSTNQLKISVVDMYGNLVNNYTQIAQIYLISDVAGQEVYTYLGKVGIGGGKATFNLPTGIASGYYVIKTTVSIPVGGESFVPYTPGKQKVYFGDLHFHTRFSDSYVNIDPRDSYTYARDTALLDFLAVSDHAEEVVKNRAYTQFLTRDIPDSWEEIKNINNEFNTTDGNFVTFLGFETTSDNENYPRDGHLNVYYKNYTGNIYPHHRQGNDVPGHIYFGTSYELWERLNEDYAQALTISHHTLYNGQMGNDFYYYDSEFEKLIEIYSSHGCSESTTCENAIPKKRQNANGSVQRALGWSGYRLGFIGGSDNHFGHPSGVGLIDGKLRKSGGLTAVIAKTLNKDSLWNAMTSRSTYATSGERIYLEFTINGANMGSEIYTQSSPIISARVIGTGNIINVEIIKYDNAGGWRTIYSTSPNRLFWNYSFSDAGFNANSIYYLKVKQTGGNQVNSYFAWSSPIWVNKK